MPWEYAYGRYTDVNDLKQAYTNSNINALGVASLTATGVIKANDIDPDKIPLPSLTDLFQEWELEAGIINGIDNSKAPALSGVQGASARPIYTRTTIRHLVRLRELESSSPI